MRKICLHEDAMQPAFGVPGPRRAGTALLAAIAACLVCGAAVAQTVIGSASAGFQKWTVADLNNNGAPFWDAFTTAFQPNLGSQTSRNVGFCLTSTADCQGIGSALHAPGPLPFWGMPYDAVGDTGGGFDPAVYFKDKDKHKLAATLMLNLSSNPKEINEFGWFETDAAGSAIGTRHKLFQGGGVPPGSLTPDPVGKTASFKPTEFFGYYYADVSEGGCFTYTLSKFNDSDCADHNFVVFSAGKSGEHEGFWIAGEDPPGCGDGDCNLTLVRVRRAERMEH
ncbi:MAG: hypothetical protein KGQ35_14170 [Burkholderiales bacterium]|nr:hypothetical protein [Burkholderiales bacterium]